MKEGDLVHIPQDSMLVLESGGSCSSGYMRLKIPIRALYLNLNNLPGWVEVYYKNSVWAVRSKDVYPIN